MREFVGVVSSVSKEEGLSTKRWNDAGIGANGRILFARIDQVEKVSC